MSKRRNEYCEAFGPLYDEIPKAVFAAVAYSLGEQLATGSGAAMVLREWRILHDNAIVPQAPPPYRLRDLGLASPAGAGGGSGAPLGGPTASVAREVSRGMVGREVRFMHEFPKGPVHRVSAIGTRPDMIELEDMAGEYNVSLFLFEIVPAKGLNDHDRPNETDC